MNKTASFSTFLVSSALVLPAFILVSSLNTANANESISQAVKEGKTNLEFRYRYSYVDQDGFTETAEASTLKTRLNWQSGQVSGFSGKIEVDNVTSVFSDEYNDTRNGWTQYPVVADPEGTDINQVYLQYQDDGLTLTAGRQRVVHNDQRFVGGVAWRQNEQTFDGYRVQYKLDNGSNLDYSYIYNINRIFGPDGPNADLKGNFHLINYQHALSEKHKLAAFIYSLDFDTAIGLSSTTYGVRYSGKVSDYQLTASYARQTDGGDNPNDYSTDFMHLEVARSFNGFGVGFGMQILGQDNGVGFSTPLATLHKFQGFTDKFLATPGDGIEDYFVRLSYKFDNKLTVKAGWHQLEAEKTGAKYGDEIHLIATYPMSKQVKLLFKYASYSAKTKSSDTDKMAFMVNAKY